MTNISVITTASALVSKIDINLVDDAVNYYSNGRFSSAIFENGTCVLPPVDGNRNAGAISCLSKIKENQRFEVREMDDGNFIVKFSEFIFSVVFLDDYLKNKNQIIKDVLSSTSNEVILGKDNLSNDHIYIGIFARTRMLQDMHDRKIVKEVINDTELP
jgi:hypothetical protein